MWGGTYGSSCDGGDGDDGKERSRVGRLSEFDCRGTDASTERYRSGKGRYVGKTVVLPSLTGLSGILVLSSLSPWVIYIP